MLAAPFPSQAMLQGSKSWVPGGMFDDNDDLRFLATAINDRGLLYDFTYGSTASVDTSRRTRVMVKLLENTPMSLRDSRLGSWLVSTGVSYSLGLPTINVGYQRYSTPAVSATRLKACSDGPTRTVWGKPYRKSSRGRRRSDRATRC